MKKMILKVSIQDEKTKQKALKAVSTLSGIESMSIDMKEEKLTVIGSVDPIEVVEKLRKKLFHATIMSVGPKEEKKDDGKKEDGKKDDDNKKAYEDPIKAYEAYYKQPYPYCPIYYKVAPQEDYPNNCVIC